MSAVTLPWPLTVRFAAPPPGSRPAPDGNADRGDVFGAVTPATRVRVRALTASLVSYGRVVVAFSGGADSAFLLAAAVRAIGSGRVVAATAVSPSLPAIELTAAAAFARDLGVTHLTPGTDELARPGYRANAGDRCYHCKAELLDVLAPLAARFDGMIATGTNADDLRAGFRPGIRAGLERGARTPLADAGLTKAEIRAVSRDWGLVTADKPAAACLSSRVAYGIPIDADRLARVETAERVVRTALEAAGLVTSDLRVRDLGRNASIEVDPPLVEAVASMAGLLRSVRECGFADAAVDPAGFRSGSMNERLPDPELWR